MAVRMRLRREGKKKQPYYRVVVADIRSPRDGRFIEDIGFYQPLSEPSTISIDRDRALHWLKEGVTPSDAVLKLLRIEGIWEEFRPGDPGKDRSAKHEQRAADRTSREEARRKAEQADREARQARTESSAEQAPASQETEDDTGSTGSEDTGEASQA